jgi:transcriptional regulator
MSGKNAKTLRRNISVAYSNIYDEIKKQVNALKLKDRLRIAWRIFIARW